MVAGHVVIGWPRGGHGPLRRRPAGEVTFLDHWGEPVAAATGPDPD
jgi:hypothetical protein